MVLKKETKFGVNQIPPTTSNYSHGNEWTKRLLIKASTIHVTLLAGEVMKL